MMPDDSINPGPGTTIGVTIHGRHSLATVDWPETQSWGEGEPTQKFRIGSESGISDL